MAEPLGEAPTRLLAALMDGDREAAWHAIQAGDDVNARDPRPIIGDFVTALHLAALQGDPLLIRELISRGADINAQSGCGQTPLWLACNGGQVDAIKELLASGADTTITDREGYHPQDRIPGASVASRITLEW
ncbi:MAG: ankyrin repeat domain-containing protein [Planctomycetota bacterium]